MVKRDVRTKEDIVNYYSKVRKIKFHDDIVVKDMQTLLTYSIRDSVSPNNIIETLATFYTRGGRHCESGRIRSLDDIIKLSMYYFPGITIQDILLELFLFDKDDKVYYGYCSNIRKCNLTRWAFTYNSFKISILHKSHYTSFSYLGFNNCDIKLHQFL